MPTHPACGKTFPGGSRHGHCSGCCETFVGLAAFDAHQHRHPEKVFVCELTDKHWQDERGFWHYGRQLTEGEKRRIFG